MKLNQKGFGLIELMISILVASIIVAGLYQMVTSSWLNFGISSATARSSKSARQVDNIVNTLMFQAGYINYRRVIQNYHFNSVATGFNGSDLNNTRSWTDDVFILGGETTNLNNNTSNSVKFRFFGASVADDVSDNSPFFGDATANGFIFDCRGVNVPNTVQLEMILYVGPDGLMCNQHALEGTGDWNLNAPVVVDSSVVDMQVLYGITTREGETDSDSYYTAEYLNANNLWKDVNLVKYYMVTSQGTGQRVVRSGNGAEITLFDGFADAGYGTYAIQDSTRMHKIISGTVSLLNNPQNYD